MPGSPEMLTGSPASASSYAWWSSACSRCLPTVCRWLCRLAGLPALVPAMVSGSSMMPRTSPADGRAAILVEHAKDHRLECRRDAGLILVRRLRCVYRASHEGAPASVRAARPAQTDAARSTVDRAPGRARNCPRRWTLARRTTAPATCTEMCPECTRIGGPVCALSDWPGRGSGGFGRLADLREAEVQHLHLPAGS